MIRTTTALVTLLAAAPQLAAQDCLTANPSFEYGSNFAGWNTYGDVQLRIGQALHGKHDASIGGPESGTWATSGVWQPREAATAYVFEGVVHVAHDQANPITGDASGFVNVEWLNTNGQVISTDTIQVLTEADEVGTTHRREFIAGPAPSGTASARLILGVEQSPAQEPGRAVFDLVDFTRLTFPSYDASQWDDFPGGRSFDFAGHSWRVKGPRFSGPGPNFFSDSTANVEVIGDDLQLAIRGTPGNWTSAEIALEDPLGYGDYIFTTNSRLDTLAPNTVLGLFLWQYPACYDEANLWNQHNEFDVEISRWGDPNADLGQFVAQPYQFPGNIDRFPIDYAANQRVSYAYRWLPDRMESRAWIGGPDDESPATTIHTWTYTGPHLPRPEQPRIHMNLWYFGDGPTTNEEQLALIDDFVFRAPVPTCQADLTGDGVLDNGDIGAFVGLFLNADIAADFTGDGILDNGDIGAFVIAFLDGC